jgi:hypothetical protein
MTNNIAFSPEVPIFALSSRAFNFLREFKVIRFSISFILAVFLLTNYNYAGTLLAMGRKDSVKIVEVEKVKPVYQTVRISSLANNMGQLWDIYPTDILMWKLNYWFSL